MAILQHGHYSLHSFVGGFSSHARLMSVHLSATICSPVVKVGAQEIEILFDDVEMQSWNCNSRECSWSQSQARMLGHSLQVA